LSTSGKVEPSRSNLLSPGPSSSQARRVKDSSNSLVGSSLPTGISFRDLPFSNREIGIRAFTNPVCTFSCHSKPRTPMVKGSTLLFLSGISLSGNQRIRCRDSLPHKSPNPELRWHVRYSWPRHLLSPALSGIAGS
jgi:hypothetical protein